MNDDFVDFVIRVDPPVHVGPDDILRLDFPRGPLDGGRIEVTYEQLMMASDDGRIILSFLDGRLAAITITPTGVMAMFETIGGRL